MNILLARAFVFVLELLELAILVRVILSWIPMSKDNQIIRLIYQITEPILSPIRGLIERSSLGRGGMMLDFSPIIAFILIGVVRSIVARVFGVSAGLF